MTVWLPSQVETIADTIRTTPATIAGRGESALAFARMLERSTTPDFDPMAFFDQCGLSRNDALTYVRFVRQ